jgi:hypothetical protein
MPCFQFWKIQSCWQPGRRVIGAGIARAAPSVPRVTSATMAGQVPPDGCLSRSFIFGATAAALAAAANCG